MSRILIFATAVMIAGVPAAIGLAGNTSFAQGVDVPIPANATVLTDDTLHPEPSDDSPSAVPSASTSTDDKGGETKHAEPGDDNGGSSPSKSADDGSHRSSAPSSTHSASHSSRSASPSADQGGHSGGGSHSGGGGGGNDGSGHK